LSTDVRFPSNTDRKFSALGFVAMCQEATYAVQQKEALFDHLVGTGEQCCGHFDAERLGGFEVDHQFDLHRLLNW
jgi:hypothetical protein